MQAAVFVYTYQEGETPVTLTVINSTISGNFASLPLVVASVVAFRV